MKGDIGKVVGRYFECSFDDLASSARVDFEGELIDQYLQLTIAIAAEIDMAPGRLRIGAAAIEIFKGMLRIGRRRCPAEKVK